MPVAELHFFHADDPNGSTIFECSTDDEFVKSIELDIQRDSLGSGKVNFARKVPTALFQREIIEPETLVRVLLPAISTTKYYFGFFINPRQQQVVSAAEQGGEGFTFAGPGPKHYLERMLLWSASFSGNDNAVQREAGIWVWPETAKVGRILNRLIEEDDDNPNGPFLPDLTKSFGDVNDSDSVAWTDNVSGTDDLTLRIQDTYLKILWILEDLSGMTTDIDLGEVGAPLLQLNAYQTYGNDLSASILFEEGNNIAAELNVEGSSYAKASHALVKGDDGVYELAVRTGWSPGDLKKVVATSWDSSNNTQLDNAGVRFLRRQQNGEKQIKLNIIPGTTALNGEYFPGPPGTGSDFWVGDTISLTTGMGSPTELDYNDEPQVVTGIQLELLEAARDDTTLQAARSWAVTLALNEERKSSNTSRDLAGNRGSASVVPVLKRCKALQAGTETILRKYFSQTGLSPSGPAHDAAWDVLDTEASFNDNIIVASPDNSYTSASANANSHTPGSSTGDNVMMGHWGFVLDTDTAAIIAAGGATWRMQAIVKARHGAGISESSQHIITQESLRVEEGTTNVIRGTALACHSLALGSGATEFVASATAQNRRYPPLGATDVLTAVPGTVAGDRFIVEVGARNFTIPTSGNTLYINSTVGATDLPEDEVTTDRTMNSWMELRFTADPTGSGLHEDLVGDDPGIPHCDHRHHIVSNRDPSATDNIDQGIPFTTQWTNTESQRTWLLIDEDAGEWLLISDPIHTHPSSDISPFSLDALEDVDVSTTPPSDGDALLFDTADELWKPGSPSGFADILDIPTVETDTALVLHPDGAGGVEWDTDATGGGGGISSGSSFPGSPSDNDLFYHTGHDLLAFYDGTRWLSTTEYELSAFMNGAAGQTADASVYIKPIRADGDTYLTKMFASTRVIVANTWVLNLMYIGAAGAQTSIATLSTAGDASNTESRHEVDINALVPNGAYHLMMFMDEQTGSTSCTASVIVRYRRVLT